MIGLGCMRLSTEPERDEARAHAVIAAAIAGGVELFDSADAYCHDEHDTGHNERLLRDAPGTLVTKGGLERHGGMWHPNGRARHLAAAARASRDRLRRIDLYLLHAVDPAVPLATSVRALAKLREDGIAAAIGLRTSTRRSSSTRSRSPRSTPSKSSSIPGGSTRCAAGSSPRAPTAASACSLIVRSADRPA
jgi:aryl-alcohol dehydrogenase-like predicted oxidoreductase